MLEVGCLDLKINRIYRNLTISKGYSERDCDQGVAILRPINGNLFVDSRAQVSMEFGIYGGMLNRSRCEKKE
jgi:hypothetical protein